MTSPLNTAKRVVIKIGSALLVDSQAAAIRSEWLDSVCEDIAGLRTSGVEVVVVSSGAIALARTQMRMASGRLTLAQKQAAASIGQILLAQAWSAALAHHGIIAAQLLLTSEDTESRERHLNARSTLRELLKMGSVPVINENDAVAYEEIRFGDNDRLAARVAQMVDADTLILLSDIDGLYTADPRKDPEAQHVAFVEDVNDDVQRMGGSPPPGFSSGGMRTKLIAADIATRAGIQMAITHGAVMSPLKRLSSGARATWFCAHTDVRSARKKWIVGLLKTNGRIHIDPGAAHALLNGGSLLAVGVTKIDGSFARNDLVDVVDPAGATLARGLVAFTSDDAHRILGQRSDAFPSDLLDEGPDALIHRDDLVLLRLA